MFFVVVPFRLSNLTCSGIKLTKLSTNKTSQSHGISQSEAEEGGSVFPRKNLVDFEVRRSYAGTSKNWGTVRGVEVIMV